MLEEAALIELERSLAKLWQVMIMSVAILLDLDIVLIGLIGLIYNLKAFFTFFSVRYFQDTV